MDRFDLKLIPVFDGSFTGPSVVEWFEKAERICKLFRIKEPMLVIPFRLTTGAYIVYQQLKEEANLNEIKHALYTAFGTDESITWRRFIGRWLLPRETIDVYMTDLRKLLVPFEGISDQILRHAFLEGLPIDVSWLLQASSEPGHMSIDQLLAKAWTIWKESEYVAAAIRMEEAWPKSDGSTARNFRIPMRAPNATSVLVPITSPKSAEVKVIQRTRIDANPDATTVTIWAT